MRGDRDVDRFPSIFTMQDITLRRTTGFSYLNTLVDCLLHQMHLMPSDVIQPYPRTGPVLAVDCKTGRVP